MLRWTKWLAMAAGDVWMAASACGLAAAGYMDDYLTPLSAATTGVGLIFLGVVFEHDGALPAHGRRIQRLLPGLAVLLLVLGAVIILFRLGWLLYLDIYEPMDVYGRAP